MTREEFIDKAAIQIYAATVGNSQSWDYAAVAKGSYEGAEALWAYRHEQKKELHKEQEFEMPQAPAEVLRFPEGYTLFQDDFRPNTPVK